MEWSWEYDAPQFVDFMQLKSGTASDFVNDEDYFSVDHEFEDRNPIAKTVNKTGSSCFDQQQEKKQSSNVLTEILDAGNKAVEVIDVTNYLIKEEEEPCTQTNSRKKSINRSSVRSPGSAQGCLLDSGCGSEISQYEDKSEAVRTDSPACFGKENRGADSDDAAVFTSHAESECQTGEMDSKSGNAEDQMKEIAAFEEVYDQDILDVNCADDHENIQNSEKECTPEKILGQRGRARTRDCRRVDEVSSAKKRLSMSVDRGRDKLRLLSPSPPRDRQNSPESKLASKVRASHLTGSKKFGSGMFHKFLSAAKSQIITEAKNEACLNEIDFVPGLIENNESLVEEEKLNLDGVVPHTGIPFLSLGSNRSTFPKPFSFEERTKQMFVKKEEKIKKILEEERKARVFHAQPFPEIIYSNAQPIKTKHSKKPPTQPAPFNLRQPQQTKKAAVGEPKATAFRAKPAKVLQKEPFIPQKSSRHKIEIAPVVLSTKQRAEQRAEWERLKREKDVHFEQEKRERERQKIEREKENIRMLRAATVHKANPVRHYKPVAIVPSAKPATIPLSPLSLRKLNTS